MGARHRGDAEHERILATGSAGALWEPAAGRRAAVHRLLLSQRIG
ncbi:hypothetical protein [Streptomyces sp. NPDC055287]